jgi:hypothetical protein
MPARDAALQGTIQSEFPDLSMKSFRMQVEEARSFFTFTIRVVQGLLNKPRLIFVSTLEK